MEASVADRESVEFMARRRSECVGDDVARPRARPKIAIIRGPLCTYISSIDTLYSDTRRMGIVSVVMIGRGIPQNVMAFGPNDEHADDDEDKVFVIETSYSNV